MSIYTKYVYLIETKVVQSSAFPAIFYSTLVLSSILIQSTNLDMMETSHIVECKHVLTFTRLVPSIVHGKVEVTYWNFRYPNLHLSEPLNNDIHTYLVSTKWKVICLIVSFHLSEPLGPSVFEFLLYCEQRGPGSKYTLPLKGIGGSRRSETTLQDADSQKGV